MFPAQGDAPGRLARFLPGELPADPAERKRQQAGRRGARLSARRAAGTRIGLEAAAPGRRAVGPRHARRACRRAAAGWTSGPSTTRSIATFPISTSRARRCPASTCCSSSAATAAGAVNAVIALDLAAALDSLADGRLDADAVTETRRHDLGEVDGVRLCFTDATGLHDGRVLFTAVAERGEDTYDDGECVASGVGMLDANGDIDSVGAARPGAQGRGHRRPASTATRSCSCSWPTPTTPGRPPRCLQPRQPSDGTPAARSASSGETNHS